MQSNEGNETVFVIETCQNCKDHHWNTRHDEGKYLEYFNRVSSAIVERVPNALTMRNQIPKSYLPYDLYCNLIPNEDDNIPYFQQVPRTGGFEVSYKGLLIFSKLQGGYWPNVDLVASKCAAVVENSAKGQDVSAFLAGVTPTQDGGSKASTVKARARATPQKQMHQPAYTIANQVPPQQMAQEPAHEQHAQEPPMEEPQKFVQNGSPDQVVPEPQPSEPEQAAPEQPEPTQEEPETTCGRHLKCPDDLKGYPCFADGERGSLLSRFLTKDVWDECKDAKDAHGFSFRQAIFSGCQNTDSGIGVYAGSQDSYSTFAPLMNPVIECYHKINVNDGHVSNMDHTQLNAPPFPEEDAKMIRSTRIRVGRNLAAFPLGPGITNEQRKEIEQTVTTALSDMPDDLAGKYYSLNSLSEEERNQLIEDHFLFKEGDRFLEACGLNRDWPNGRGIFHNNEKSFLVWVNEEDQLRIISMQQGSDIGAVFSRLSRACSVIEKVASFAHSPNLGYITSCPTNLGTALRASVHIHLPQLGQRKDEFQAIADRFHVQIRGAHGEHTETNDHIYDISNKRRLGRSEVDLVQDMYDGVKAMIAREKELNPQEAEAKPAQAESAEAKPAEAKPAEAAPAQDDSTTACGSHLKTPEDIKGFPVFPEGTKSLLCKCLTKEVWEKCKDTVDKHGFNFRQAILSGCQNTDSGIGCYAGSHDSYTAFAPLLDAVVENYHGHKKDDKHVSNMDHTQLNAPPFSEDDAKMIRSTRIRVGRNLADFPLGPGITKEQRLQIEQKVTEACNSFGDDLAGKYYSLGSLSDEERKQLIDDHFLFKEGDRFLEACGLNREWPEGRGIFHNNEKSFLVWVNEEDQLRIISMQPGADIGAVFSRLSRACAHIETVAKFSHDEHLGYITSCPTNLGTALRASVHIHLPVLGQRKDDFQAIADKFHVQIRGAHGEHTETNDHVYDISNKRRLGRSEVDLVQDMYDGVKAMIAKERELGSATEAAQAEGQ